MGDIFRTLEGGPCHITGIETTDGHRYLVVRFNLDQWKTVVLRRTQKPACWISEREVDGEMDPELALSGLLMSVHKDPNVIDQLKKELAGWVNETWKLRKELSDLREQVRKERAGKKRGKRGS